MTPRLPEWLGPIVSPVFDALPLDRAMPELVVKEPSPALGRGAEQYEDPRERAYEAVSHAVSQLADHPALQAALWLYVDDLDRSHRISQNLPSALGSYLHGVMHRREGDFSNAKYWFRQAGVVRFAGLDPFQFVDDVASASSPSADLLERQRREWAALLERCAEEC